MAITIGERIRAERKKKNLTQKKLGELCGMKEAQIRQYEIGKANPKLETIERIASALGIHPYSLLDFPIPSGATIFEDEQGERMISMPIDPDKLYIALNMDDGMITIYSHYNKLNDEGKQKAVEYTTDLAQMKKYQKKEDK